MEYSFAGVFYAGSDGTDINSVHASGETLLAAGDDSSAVRLYRYPCVSNQV